MENDRDRNPAGYPFRPGGRPSAPPGEGHPVRVWALSDGRAGNRAQAAGLAEALARRRPAVVQVHDLPPRPGAALLPAWAWHALSRIAPGGARLAHAGGAAALSPPWPDLVIGAGRRVAPLVAWLGRAHGVATVQVLDPQMPLSAFDLLVVPEHDRLRGARVLESLGAPGRVTPELIAAEAARWRDRLAPLPAPRLAVLIGGPGRMARWAAGDADRLRDALAGLADAGWSLLVTASRRTDPALLPALRARLDPARHLLHDGRGENPYPAILGLAEAVLVTEDSVNMASEAASSGLPVHVFRVGGASAKARRFHEALSARGIARDFAGRIDRWTYAPLAEADRLAGAIEARLLRG